MVNSIMKSENYKTIILNFLSKFYHLIAGILVFLVYYSSTSRSIGENDSGELAAVQATWGIAHPTGYPLFSITGYIYSKLPIAEPLIFQLNLLQCIFNSLTVIVLIKIIEKILLNFKYFINDKRFPAFSNISINQWTVLITSIIGGLTFAFSITFWKQSTRVEVYSLQIFLTSLILYLFIDILTKHLKSESSKNQQWYLIAILIGLAFSNHMMTLYLLPATIYLFFTINHFEKKSYILFVKLLLVSFSIAFFFYLLMMFRAQSDPPFTFMNEPKSFPALIDYVRGKYYESKMFQGAESVRQQTIQFLNILSFNKQTGFTGGEFGFLIIPVFSGLLFVLIFFRRLRMLYILIIATSLFFVLNYSIPDIDEYFLVIFLLFSIASTIIIGVLATLAKKIQTIISAFFLTLIFWQLYTNFPEIDRSNDYVVEDYSREVLKHIPANKILLTSDWPLFAAPSFFLQYALGYRKDIEVLGIEMLPLPSYKLDVKKRFGSVENLLKDDYYITFDVFKDYIRKGKFNLGDKTIIPEGLCFRLSDDKNYSDYYPIPKKMRFLNKRTIFHEYIYHLTGFMLEARARYEIENGKIDKAKMLLMLIKKDYPDYSISPDLKTYL
ncbi:Hypothetical protein IALB_0552 [Ignavibacterium album JCM 16511]|uniref:DUF2723 domain-containing protein n=2 Tax=Ignavibacterium album TaxID=591197 RepID=I0AH07_IGNAJ|nr:Hypothetical protein IALB_0552 [Ignavibacterium album JCM 16511]